MRGSGKLPDGLGEQFSVVEAASRERPPGRLRSADLERPFRGVRVRAVRNAVPRASAAEAERDDAWQRIMAYAQIMPEHAFFIGPTAALIRRVQCRIRGRTRCSRRMRYPRTPPRRAGSVGPECAWLMPEVVDVLSITTPALTWATLGPFLSEYDLVAATDYLLRLPRSPGGFHALARTTPFATRDELATVLRSNRLRRARTAPRARAGTNRVVVAAGEPGASDDRRCRIARPEIDYDIRSESGMFIACADLGLSGSPILAIDYEGDGHRERAQFEHDINRFARMEEHRWRAVRLTSEQLFHIPREAIRRILRAYQGGDLSFTRVVVRVSALISTISHSRIGVAIRGGTWRALPLSARVCGRRIGSAIPVGAEPETAAYPNSPTRHAEHLVVGAVSSELTPRRSAHDPMIECRGDTARRAFLHARRL